MIVEERDKILPGFAVRTNERLFDLFAAFENAGKFCNVSQTFYDVRNLKEERVVESGIDTKSGFIRTVPSHEPVDCFLAIVDFAESEKVPFPKCLGKFSNRVAESFN